MRTAAASANPAARFLRDAFRQGARVFWDFFKIAFPLVLAARALDVWFDFTAMLGGVLAPLMAFANLPGEAGIVWAAAMLINVYAAMLLAAGLWDSLALSGAQATVLAVMMLIAHSLPVELRIAQKAGAKMPAMFAIRFFGALFLGAALSLIYEYGGWLQEPAALLLAAPEAAEFSWKAWFLAQLQNWIVIFCVVLLLVALIRLMKITRAERAVLRFAAPPLRLMGIGERAALLTVTGMTLGLSYGGALLIAEAKNGNLEKRDILCAFALLSLCHSVIEDTLALMLLGAHISGVLFARVLFAAAFTAFFARAIRASSEKTLTRFFIAAAR